MAGTLSWVDIFRMGLVQMALGSIVALTTSTLNRVMVVELALPATLPGLLICLHYGLQILRPSWGHGSDGAARRTPWILGGIATLALGGFVAAVGVALMATNLIAGICLAVVAFILIGLGVGAGGTSLLAMLAKRAAPERRAAAATIVWVMMISGIVITSILAGKFLDPFSYTRLVVVAASVSCIALALAVIGIWGIEGEGGHAAGSTPTAKQLPFMVALREVWAEPEARKFTIFVFVSMLAYSAQDLILEPYAGAIFNFTPGQSTKLSGVQHGGVLAGMILVALIARGKILGSLRVWTVGGCLASAVALIAIAIGGPIGPSFPLREAVFAMGIANGAFAVAAIGSMMELASADGGKTRATGEPSREGLRMGLWGAAQALAFGVGGLFGAAMVDIMSLMIGRGPHAYGVVFCIEAAMFIASGVLALQIGKGSTSGLGFGRGARQEPATLVGAGMLATDAAE
jgi:MFS transporter, BCD family, chlorophyll transporter